MSQQAILVPQNKKPNNPVFDTYIYIYIYITVLIIAYLKFVWRSRYLVLILAYLKFGAVAADVQFSVIIIQRFIYIREWINGEFPILAQQYIGALKLLHCQSR